MSGTSWFLSVLVVSSVALTGCMSTRERFTATANDVYAQEKVTPELSAEREIVQLIEQAAAELDEKKASSSDVSDADAQLRQVVTEMARETHRRACERDSAACSGGARPILGLTVDDLKKIKAKFCPLYPFC